MIKWPAGQTGYLLKKIPAIFNGSDPIAGIIF